MVLVAAFIPIIQNFATLGINSNPLWWVLLFGGCLGGNITMIGSTANIAALGMLDKQKKFKMSFLQWFKIGSVVGLITTAIVWFILITFDSFFKVL